MSSILQTVAPIGEARDREMLKDASCYIYLQTPQDDLVANIFFPPSPVTTPRPAVIFFHGGFWDIPMPTQFIPHCHHFSGRGAVAIAAETRTTSKHGTGPLEAIDDARALIRWVRNNAEILNVDPAKITVAGAAGGALLALLTAMPKEKHLPDVEGVSCRPQALLLFSALVDTTVKSPALEKFPTRQAAKLCSPSKMVRGKLPPMMFFHARNDRMLPAELVENFCRRLRWRRKNVVELVEFDRADHSFFNFNVSQTLFEVSLEAADRFLVKHGLLEPLPVEEAVALI